MRSGRDQGVNHGTLSLKDLFVLLIISPYQIEWPG